jgi:hypothetical protein
MAQLRQSEEELVSLLGRAVKDVWGAVPPFAQDQILDHACELERWPVRKALKVLLEKKQTPQT